MRGVIVTLLLVGCAHAPKLPPKPWPEPMPVARPCIEGEKLERALLDPLVPNELVKLVDEEGESHVGARLVVTPKSLSEFFQYIMRLESEREHARTACVTR